MEETDGKRRVFISVSRKKKSDYSPEVLKKSAQRTRLVYRGVAS